jgi:hypothetical protein
MSSLYKVYTNECIRSFSYQTDQPTRLWLEPYARSYSAYLFSNAHIAMLTLLRQSAVLLRFTDPFRRSLLTSPGIHYLNHPHATEMDCEGMQQMLLRPTSQLTLCSDASTWSHLFLGCYCMGQQCASLLVLLTLTSQKNSGQHPQSNASLVFSLWDNAWLVHAWASWRNPSPPPRHTNTYDHQASIWK